MPVSISSQPRIISLSPAWIEWMAALGVEHLLVARTSEGNSPYPGKSRSSVTSATVGDEAKVDLGALEEMKPDIILSASPLPAETVFRLTAKLGKPLEEFSLAPTTFRQIPQAVIRLGGRLGLMRETMAVVGGLERDLKRMRDQLGLSKRTPAHRLPGVVCLESLRPLTAAGLWIPDLVELAGGRPLLVGAGRPSVDVTWEQLRDCEADLVAVILRGRTLESGMAEAHNLEGELNLLGATRIHVFDGASLFHTPGPGLYRSTAVMAAALHGFDTGVESWESQPLESRRDL